MSFIKVVLPLPLVPTMAVILLAGMVKFKLSKTFESEPLIFKSESIGDIKGFALKEEDGIDLTQKDEKLENDYNSFIEAMNSIKRKDSWV